MSARPQDTAIHGEIATVRANPATDGLAAMGRFGSDAVQGIRTAQFLDLFQLCTRRGKHMAILKEFQEFAVKGNVVDLAVGVIIGAAFGNIVTSLVGDVFMPVIGAVTGGLDFSNYFIPLSSTVTADNLADAKKQGAVLAYGSFITIAINFLIIAAVLFLVVRVLNSLRRQAEEKTAEVAAGPTKEEELLTEIRDLLARDVARK